MGYYAAIDIGASSGRVILAYQKHSKINLTEIHRFKNNFEFCDGHYRWDIDRLIYEIFVGLEKIKKKGIEKLTIGIDTWAIDYVLLDASGKPLGKPISYRDDRTKNSFDSITRKLTREYIYSKTGIQFQKFNTIYQLASEDKQKLNDVDKILLIPDYIAYVLTGRSVCEISNASTTQMINLETGEFDDELLTSIGVKHTQFAEIVEPGTILGKIKTQWKIQYDIPDVTVIAVATHDTASAIAGIPMDNEAHAYISSGTWSLIGTEEVNVRNTPEALERNYTNSRGAEHSYTFLKNIMGMWMAQCVKRDYPIDFSFQKFADMAKSIQPFQQLIDVNDDCFLNPQNMIRAIQMYSKKTKQKIPRSPGEIMMAVYSNLALYYAVELKYLKLLTGSDIKTLYIVGGGSNVSVLNQLTANLSNVTVEAGPSEATALGNIVIQMIAMNELKDLSAGRQLIKKSDLISKYTPQVQSDNMVKKYEKFITRKEDDVNYDENYANNET